MNIGRETLIWIIGFGGLIVTGFAALITEIGYPQEKKSLERINFICFAIMVNVIVEVLLLFSTIPD